MTSSFLFSIAPSSPSSDKYDGDLKAFIHKVIIPVPCVLLPLLVTWLLVMDS